MRVTQNKYLYNKHPHIGSNRLEMEHFCETKNCPLILVGWQIFAHDDNEIRALKANRTAHSFCSHQSKVIGSLQIRKFFGVWDKFFAVDGKGLKVPILSTA